MAAVGKALKNAVSKNADDALKTARKTTKGFYDKIETLQKNVDSGMSVSDAVGNYLNKRDKVNNALIERRTRQAAANKAYMSKGSGNKAERRAAPIRLEKEADEIVKNIKRDEILSNKRIKDSLNYNQNSSPQLSPQMRSTVGMESPTMAEVNRKRYSPNINEQNSMFSEMSQQEFNMLDSKARKVAQEKGIPYDKNMNSNKLTKEQIEIKKQEAKNRLEDRGIDYNTGKQKKESGSLLEKAKGNNFVYNMAAMGVGGALVLNMANNKGQQSNAQLYGQY